MSAFELIDTYYSPDSIDCYSFVFNEVDPLTGYHTMLATSETGQSFSQWTEGRYDVDGDNEHLGFPVCVIGKALLSHLYARMAEG